MGSVELGQREQTTAPPHQAYDTMLGDGEILPSRSLSLAAVGLLLFAPYIYLESHNQYADIRRMFQLGGVQLHSPQADVLSSPGRASQWLATRWTVQNMQIPQPCTTYQYVFNSQLEGGPRVDNSNSANCPERGQVTSSFLSSNLLGMLPGIW